MLVPSVESLPDWLAEAAKHVADRLRDAGHRAWIVGGAVRDLALGLEPSDADLCSAATPDQVEALFQGTHAVGRAFGTVVVPVGDRVVQLTTFRAERGYSDARHPDQVRYAATPEEDALRRDFTCNALYLDPLTDEVLDPAGGLADLDAGQLRCVGDPVERFREDGLRLIRLARFAAGYDLAPAPGVAEAARASADALRGVSPERVLEELHKVCARPRMDRAVSLLHDADLLDHALPGAPPGWDRRVVLLERLGSPVPVALGLAALLDPAAPAQRSASTNALHALRPSRELRRGVTDLWDGALEAALLAQGGSRARRIRLVRRPDWPGLSALAAARADGRDALDDLRNFASGLGPEDLHPAPLVTSDDLAAAGVPRGPRWSELLREAEDLQLAGELGNRDEALVWLRTSVGEHDPT